MSTYIRTATVLVRINTGSPTWWLPNFKVERRGRTLHISTGWLRCAIQVGIGTKRHHEEER